MRAAAFERVIASSSSRWATFGFVVATAGCASPSPPAPTAAPPVAATAVDGDQAREPRYLRYRPEETGLVAVHDDGRDTYLEFGSPIPRTLAVHDHEGRLLPMVVSEVVVAVPGLHAGLLIRRDDAASFAAPNPRRRQDLSQPLPDRADFIDARARLQGGGQLQAAMARAIAAARSPGSPGQDPGAGAGNGNVLLPAPPPLPAAAARPWASPQAAVAPLTAANLLSVQPEQGLLRVYFASASRAIVAPDDGLATLLREAARADRIRITGHTDAVGSRATNLMLARARADAVAEILVRRGIEPARIEVSAVAADEFIADNATDRGRALNRRAEIQLLRDGRPLRLGASR